LQAPRSPGPEGMPQVQAEGSGGGLIRLDALNVLPGRASEVDPAGAVSFPPHTPGSPNATWRRRVLLAAVKALQ